MESTDVIIVGSSIVAMLEATMQARNGKSVVVMEQDDVLGGCWRTMSIPYCTGLNYGSHLFRRNRTYWDFLSKHCNTEFTPLLPQPECVWGRHFFTEDSIAHHLAIVARKLREFVSLSFNYSHNERERWIRYGISLLRYPLTIANACLRCNRRFYYPTHGLNDLLQNLRDQLQDNGVSIRFRHRVDRVEIDRKIGRAIVTCDPVGKMSAETVVVFANTYFEASESFTLEPETPVDRMDYPHLCMVVDDASPKKFSHLNFIYHPLVVRINDYTEHVVLNDKHTDGTIKILHAWIRNIDGLDYRDQADRIIGHLVELDKLGKGTRLRDHYFYDHSISLNTRRNANHINRHCHPNVHMVFSYSMVDAIGDLASRWSRRSTSD